MEYTNKLINEKSPYLLQHAHNPVNWYPWSSEAFEEAKNRDLPIFLSIGYSSCHWCHVMERESFEDTQVAEILNKNFISIKVDREEMPDVDHIFMDVCTTLTGKGGWPLSCFITYDEKPFFAGTYFPKTDHYGMPGFTTILKNISINWKQDREDLIQASDEILEHISQASNFGEKSLLNDNISKTAFEQLTKSFDKKYGGFGSSPKFPSTHNLLFLIRYYLLYKDKTAIDIVDKTLDCMYNGGIFDHIGGGFCRYSTDKKWLVPHFEKMMYDNAMLIIAYCEAGIVIDNKYFDIAKRIINYCINEMRDKNSGGFYTAQDADSEGVEGKFYVFTPSEIKEALGENEGDRFCTLFDITENGNFEGKSIPNLINKNQTGEDSIFADYCFPKLYEYRQKRVPPFKDDKLLTQINGLMVASLSIAGRLLNDDKYLSYAEETALFIIENLSLNDRLYTGFRGKLLKHPATSDDYAYVLWGMFELYQATLKPKWLHECIHIAEKMLELFIDENGQGLYLSGNDVEHLPIRGKNTFDGALPSGNSISANIFLKLSQLTGNDKFANASNMIISGIANDVNSYPTAFTGLLCADLHNSNQINVNIVNGEHAESMLSFVNNFNPFITVCQTGVSFEEMNEILNEQQKNIDNKATAYICSKNGCMPPINDFIELKEKLKIQ